MHAAERKAELRCVAGYPRLGFTPALCRHALRVFGTAGPAVEALDGHHHVREGAAAAVVHVRGGLAAAGVALGDEGQDLLGRGGGGEERGSPC